ncbi:Endonuclease/exonuclease/phosphatase, partial [Fomitopsis serialis]|uniref:Endonuclease/exonuclease/phosphatase n=1 Tax=Fomitopsis serialis TaxID=139415 RepID=UPI002008B3A4
MPCRTTGHSDRPSGRHTKASLNICSLNLNGRGGPVGPQNCKWNEINQLVREDRIGLLCLQETHLSADDSDTVKKLYGRCLAIWNSPSTTASSQQGVAIVLNRELVDTANVHFQVLVPGRAALLRLHWHAEKRLTVLNVYAPNAPRDNAAFWQLLLSMAERGKYQTPDILAGDFNIVEEAIDRLPAKEDNIAAVTSFRDLLRRFRLHDGWRTSEPTRKEYTFPQRGSLSCSRLDRIYASMNLINSSHTWTIRATSVHTDHKLVSAALTTPNSPFIGRGRWTMPLHLLSDVQFMQDASALGKTAMDRMKTLTDDTTRTPGYSIQHIHAAFKRDIQTLARQRLRVKTPKLAAEIKRL